MPVGPEIIVGVLSSIVYDGLKRPYKGIADIVYRRRAINRSLNQIPEPERGTELRPELNDLIRVLGNDHGVYDDNVAQFFYEIERSAIPDALKHFSMCGKDPEAAYPAFDLLYKSHAPLPFPGRALFDALNTAIKTRLHQGVEEKILYEAIKANTGEILHRLDALASCLENAQSLDVLPSSQFGELRIKVAKGIEAANRQVNVETTQGTKKILISKLVIAPRLSPLTQKEILAAHRDAHHDRTHNISYINFRRTFSRVVILGDPGGGKSTLTQILCYDLATQIGLEASAPRHPSFDTRDLMIPLRIILRTLEKKQQKDPSYNIFDYLVDDIRVYCDNDHTLATKFLKQALALGEAVLLFDGLDEVLEVGARRAMTALIEQFVHAYSTCPSIVTSRIVGYKDAPLSDDFVIYTLSRLNKDEVRKFSGQLIRAVSGLKKAEAEKKAETFISQTENTASDLRENPLLLGLMVYIFNARGDVPNNRPEIYKECSMLMFEKWDQRRDIIFDFPQDFNLLDLFGYLASNIFGSAEMEDGVTEEWLVGKLKSFFFSWYDEDKARSYEAAKVLVNFITGRAWVMCDIGPHLFKFTHRTFLEYFFARRLEEEAGGTVALLQGHLISKVIKAEWDVVSHLALQISTYRSGVRSTQALDALLKYGADNRLGPEEETNFLTFIAKALEYLIVSESKMREVLDYVFHRCIHLGANFNVRSIEIIHDILRATHKRAAFVEKRMREQIAPILAGRNSTDRSFALYLIGARFTGFSSGSMNGLVTPSDRVWNAFAESRAKIQSEELKRAFKDVDEARTYIYIYRTDVIELYRKFRVGLFGLRPSALVPAEIASLAPILFLSTLKGPTRTRIYFEPPFGLNEKQASELLELIAEDMLVEWRANRVKDVLGGGDYMANELFEDLIFRSREDAGEEKRVRRARPNVREIFLMLLFLWAGRSSRAIARVGPKALRVQHKSTLSRLVAEEWAFPADDPYGQAILEIIHSLKAELGSLPERYRSLNA
ncbi:hypothetical protein FJ970_21895 [Mesorhizobium sp. B2-1-8]|uniref:NACHT domain-containing protein n=1 Tax=Mesorhizobium sp. B2-1-8 TaxID=2589967 RepID=UPI001129A63F|nr:hypothetical protein [Mesorhizobium sp. B2-1-8]UCI17745.1 hypothetical protein FJ970_21895 [Mesorhizobium sp. B2-1-8]